MEYILPPKKTTKDEIKKVYIVYKIHLLKDKDISFYMMRVFKKYNNAENWCKNTSKNPDSNDIKIFNIDRDELYDTYAFYKETTSKLFTNSFLIEETPFED